MNTNDHPSHPQSLTGTRPAFSAATDAAAPPVAARRRPRSLWRIPAYRDWFVADTADVFAVSLRTFAIPLIGLALSGSPFVAGLLVTIESAIGLVLMSVGGAIADRHDRRRLMMLLGLIGMTLSVTTTGLLVSGVMTTIPFAMLIAAFAVMNGLLGPSNDAMLKSLVPMDRFAKAQAIREARESCVELSGGAIGGLLYRIAGWCPFLASAVLYLAATITAMRLPRHATDDATDVPTVANTTTRHTSADEPFVKGANGMHAADTTGTDPTNAIPTDGVPTDAAPTADGHGNAHAQSFLAQFAEGWRWTLTRRTILSAIAQGAVVNVACYGSIVGVQIMLAERGTDPALIGLVGTATGVSALVGSLMAGWLVDRMPTGKLIILTFAVFGAAMIPLLFTDSYGVVIVCTAVASLLFPALNAGELGFIFGRTPDGMQGRVSTVFETTIGVPGAFTPALVGWLLQAPGLGFRAVMTLVVACALIGLALACLTPTRRIPRPEHWEETEL